MSTYIMLTRIHSGIVDSPIALQALEKEVESAIDEACPGIEWLANFAVSGPYDYVDIFRAPDFATALKASTLVKTMGCAQTELWTATEWSDYKNLLRTLPMREETERGQDVSIEDVPDGRFSEAAPAFVNPSASVPLLNEDNIRAISALQPTRNEFDAALSLALDPDLINTVPRAWSMSGKSREIYRILTGTDLPQPSFNATADIGGDR